MVFHVWRSILLSPNPTSHWEASYQGSQQRGETRNCKGFLENFRELKGTNRKKDWRISLPWTEKPLENPISHSLTVEMSLMKNSVINRVTFHDASHRWVLENNTWPVTWFSRDPWPFLSPIVGRSRLQPLISGHGSPSQQRSRFRRIWRSHSSWHPYLVPQFHPFRVEYFMSTL